MAVRFSATELPDAAALLMLWLRDARSLVAFTGAGVSTESGIPDFRSPGGVWAQNRPVYFDEFCRSAEARYEYWRQKSIAHRDFADAQPNVTHQALADWESRYGLSGVITQNIDGLHRKAGSSRVLELHGTATQVACLDCAWRDEAGPWVERFLTDDAVPGCPSCGGLVKHATVSFGQQLPEDVLNEAVELSQQADLFITMGSSLVVEPAASLPRLAKRVGARLVIINREPTPLDGLANLLIEAPLGDFFDSLRHAEAGEV